MPRPSPGGGHSGEIEFATLRDIVDVSDSVRSKHLSALGDAGYAKLSKAKQNVNAPDAQVEFARLAGVLATGELRSDGRRITFTPGVDLTREIPALTRLFGGIAERAETLRRRHQKTGSDHGPYGSSSAPMSGAPSRARPKRSRSSGTFGDSSPAAAGTCAVPASTTADPGPGCA